ncbi:hypothetical protein FGF66_05185 [Chlorobaculum thiosulfatiphilum]|uniref:site-specific DNA-methyltransferase (adenine-specific) n=2 Tax=Chlorobaculum thiosulfatiphilum TaxID=115852 RepID=A0A5C4S7W7_CHLTI|nr:hypothetical protein FGF66_05185 [Chlorobaculum thiosulfatiphilum]
MHMLLVCEEDEVADIVRKVKGRTSRELHRYNNKGMNKEKGISNDPDNDLDNDLNKGFKPLVKSLFEKEGEKSVPLWTQKFGCKEIKDHNQLANTIDYIRNNRLKHNLPPNARSSNIKGKGIDSTTGIDSGIDRGLDSRSDIGKGTSHDLNKGFKPLVHHLAKSSLVKIIDNFTTTVEHAFRTEHKGGFDVVIGNPPYVSANEVKKFSTKEQYNFLKSNYETAKGTVDLYIYFFERGMNILHPNGYLSYITPNRFLSASYGTALREHIIANYEIESIVNYSDKKVFPDASTYPIITVLANRSGMDYDVNSGKFNELTKEFEGKPFPSKRLQIIDKSILGFLLNDKLPITEKVINQSDTLAVAGVINATSTASEADEYSTLINQNSGYKLINTGTIDPYFTTWGREELTDKGAKHLFPYLPKDSETISANRHNLYSSPKIIISKIGLRCEAFYDRNGEYASINTNCIHSFSDDFVPEYLLAWLNSKLYNYTFECLFDGLRMSGGYLLFSAPNLKSTSIKKIDSNKQMAFVPLVRKIEKQILTHLELRSNFIEHFRSKFSIDKPSMKIQNWPELDFNGFLAELTKAKVKLSLEEEAEWMQYFNKKKAEANALKSEIDRIDRKIDQMVYELYGLTHEEIKIVENS